MAEFKFKKISIDELLKIDEWEEQIEIIRSPIENSILVYWLPWCWKTLVATHRLDKFNDVKTLFFVYNKLLKWYIKWWLEKFDSKNKVFTFHEIFNSLVFDTKKKEDLEYRSIYSEKVKEVFNSFVNKKWKLDLLMIDECQDLPIEIYNHLNILSDNINLFWDAAQSIFPQWIKHITDLENLIKTDINFKLVINKRNPAKIYDFALQLKPTEAWINDVKLKKKIKDPVIIYEAETKLKEEEQIIDILKDYWEYKNIVITAFTQKELDYISNLLDNNWYDNKYTKYHSNMDLENINIDELKNIIVCTYHSIKWLEFDVVILPSPIDPEYYYKNITTFHWPYSEKQLYTNNVLFTTFTRATEKLIITYTKWNLWSEKLVNKFNNESYKKVML